MENEATLRQVTLSHCGHANTKGEHIREATARDGHPIAIREPDGDRQVPRRLGAGRAQLVAIRIRGLMVNVRVLIADPLPSQIAERENPTTYWGRVTWC